MTASVVPVRPYSRKNPPSTDANSGSYRQWIGRELHAIEQTHPGFFIPPWPKATIRTASDKMSDVLSVLDFDSSAGDGSHDAYPAIKAAYDTCVAEGRRDILFPDGNYYMSQGLTCGTSPFLYGLTNPIGGQGGDPGMGVNILKDFAGDLFTLDGSDGLAAGGGGGFANLRMVQAYSTGSGVSGSAVVLKTSASGRVVWWKMWNVLIEENGVRPWTWAVDVNGAAVGPYANCFDLYMGFTSTHTTGTGAVRVNGGNINMAVVNCYDTAGNITFGDSLPTNQNHLTDVSGAGTLAVDQVSDFVLNGGTWTTITNTANSAGVLKPTKLVNAFTDNSGGSMGFDYFDSPTKTWIRTP